MGSMCLEKLNDMFEHTKPREWLMFSLILKKIWMLLVNIIKIKISPFTVSLRKEFTDKNYYHTWDRSSVQVWCLRQGTQSRCTETTMREGMGGRWERGSGWRMHVHPWLIYVNVWQKPLQYCKVISLQLK